MICVIPFCEKDVSQAQDLLRWCSELRPQNHPCLLVVDHATPWNEVWKTRWIAEEAFTSVQVISNPAPVEGWIVGSNSLFRAAAEWCAGQRFFWCEPDAAPLRSTWLDEIETAYAKCGKPFMGTIVNHLNAQWPNPYLEGCGVYPPDCWQQFAPIWNPNESWTKAMVSVTIPNAVHTELIHHLWGESGNPPTFAERNTPGTNVFCLSQISPQACFYHRCKDGTLIRLLRQKAGIVVSEPAKLMVVFPFCNKDATMFVKTVGWMRELCPHYDYDAVLSYDHMTGQNAIEQMRIAVQSCFRNVFVNAYAPPRGKEWPPTIAFIAAANYMAAQHQSPWLWTEFDMIPLKPSWLQVLDDQYRRCGKPFMGPVVPNRGHVNGTAIYPHDTPDRLRRAFQEKGTAWDVAAKAEMIGDTHDCSRIFQHVWGVHQGKLHPFIGNAPSFVGNRLFQQILPTAVVFHRCKNGTLIDELRRRKR